MNKKELEDYAQEAFKEKRRLLGLEEEKQTHNWRTPDALQMFREAAQKRFLETRGEYKPTEEEQERQRKAIIKILKNRIDEIYNSRGRIYRHRTSEIEEISEQNSEQKHKKQMRWVYCSESIYLASLFEQAGNFEGFEDYRRKLSELIRIEPKTAKDPKGDYLKTQLLALGYISTHHLPDIKNNPQPQTAEDDFI